MQTILAFIIAATLSSPPEVDIAKISVEVCSKVREKNRDSAILMDDGNLNYHFLNGIFPGGQPECGKLFLFLNSIHPSLAYIINNIDIVIIKALSAIGSRTFPNLDSKL